MRRSCADLRDLAPELALGGLTGSERADALEHLVACEDCRTYVEELSDVADRLLLLAPQDEPPAGFESRVLGRLVGASPAVGGPGATERPVRARRTRLLAVAAAVALVLAGAGVVAGVVASRPSAPGNSALSSEYVRALQGVGGHSLRAAPLLDAAHRRVGQAFMYDGDPSWVFVSLDGAGVDGSFTVVCTGPGAGPVAWPGLHVNGGHGTLGWTVPGGVRGLTELRVVDDAGNSPYHAVMDATPAS